MRRGARSCPALQRIVGRFSIPPLTLEMCRTVERHVEGCAVCEQTRRSLLAPLALFGAFAVVPPPAGVKERIWKNLETQWAQPGYRSVKKASLGKSLSMMARKSEAAERGSSQSIGGRDLFVVLCAVLLLGGPARHRRVFVFGVRLRLSLRFVGLRDSHEAAADSDPYCWADRVSDGRPGRRPDRQPPARQAPRRRR